ncbi:MAG: hypothetical protein M3419_01660 [Actinomycetota bacterium]|nr:hypothetical protein [Actinomycetota bacterium]
MGLPAVDLEAWAARLAEPLRGRKVIVAFRVLATMPPAVTLLAAHGAAKPLLIAHGVGTGPVPGPDEAHIRMLDVESSGGAMTDDVRRVSRWSVHPPPQVAAWVEEYDPHGEACWLASPFACNEPLLGRPVVGGRAPGWAAVEDKMQGDAWWTAGGVEHLASAVVPATLDAATAAALDVDRGQGCVWSGDARDGINGGAEYVRRVRDEAQARDAAAFFAARCDRVRISPYLEGTACGIHGFVLPDGVAAFRPVEQMTLVDPASGRFVFAGMSTWWDPPPGAREDMRASARRIGEVLRERVGYRGGFSIDGVLTTDGFRPTELNPRFSGGLNEIARAVAPLPLELAQYAAVSGREVGVAASMLEVLVTEAADAHRFGTVIAVSSRVRVTGTEEVAVVLTDGNLTPATPGTEPDATMLAGPAGFDGTFIRCTPADSAIATGQSLGVWARAVHSFADERWGTAFGPLEAPSLATR